MIGEVVIVKRSNGTLNFAKVERFNPKNATYDVSLDSGDSKNPASCVKAGLTARQLGKIAIDPNRIVTLMGLNFKDQLTEPGAMALNYSQVFLFNAKRERKDTEYEASSCTSKI
jgi:hypothetical protein